MCLKIHWHVLKLLRQSRHKALSCDLWWVTSNFSINQSIIKSMRLLSSLPGQLINLHPSKSTHSVGEPPREVVKRNFPGSLKQKPELSFLCLPVLLSFLKSGPLSGPHTGCSWSPTSVQLRVKKANCGPLFVFLAQHICVFFQ